MYKHVLELRKSYQKERIKPEDLGDDPLSIDIFKKPKAELLAAAIEKHQLASGQMGKSDERI
jgi:hypothetical protein